MTIDAIIAKLTLDAIKKDKKYQNKTTKIIDFLSKNKSNFNNDFDYFLESTLNRISNNMAEYERNCAKIKNGGFNLFLRVVKLRELSNDTFKIIDNINPFIVDFINNNKNDEGIYTEQAKNYIKNQNKIQFFMGKSTGDFMQIEKILIDVINNINDDDIKNLIVLANAKQYLDITKTQSIILKNALSKKIKELNIPMGLLQAYNITYLREYANEYVDGMRASLLIGSSASEHVNAINDCIALEHYKIINDFIKEEDSPKKLNFRPIFNEETLTILRQNEYSLDKSTKKRNKEKNK